jgi:hypothetical protein
MRYVVTPQAKQDYNNDNSAYLNDDVNSASLILQVSNTSSFSVNDRIIVGSEIMLVTGIVDADTLNVQRGYNNTNSASHLTGAIVNRLTAVDDALVEADDDFGFNESWTYLGDSKEYSPTRKLDI